MSSTLPKKNNLELAFATLTGADEAATLDALDRIEVHGDAKAIRPLLQALAKTAHHRHAPSGESTPFSDRTPFGTGG